MASKGDCVYTQRLCLELDRILGTNVYKLSILCEDMPQAMQIISFIKLAAKAEECGRP